MDESSVSVLWYRTSKPLGKVRRRVQDLRIPSSSFSDYKTNRPALDLSHNESARLAVDTLLSGGLEEYHEVLKAEGEVDFLSDQEKIYILENGTDGKTELGASDDDDDDDDDDIDFENSSAGSQTATQCPTVSTDSDPTVAGVKWNDPVLDVPSAVVYYQSGSRAAGMKDLVREFIRKARMALAIVMDSFTDVELLCDLLEASRKRNVSVYLLLDHLNLKLFVSMWQDLKLNGKNFPKLSVSSVQGQTYCTKTGRKLTGQIAESFIITDWTEVLTGSYSFSWLSWQVHRSFAVLIKGSPVIPFHQEFLRLYSSSKPVPGFVTFITVPHTLPLYTTSCAAQNANTDASESKSSPTTMCHTAQNGDAQNTQTKAKMPVLSSPQSAEIYPSVDNSQPLHRAGNGTQIHEKPQMLHPKPPVQAETLQSVSVGKPKHTVGAVCTQHGAQTGVKPLEKNQNQTQSHSNPLSQTQVSNVQSQLKSLTITTPGDKKKRAQESNPLHTAPHTNGQHRSVSYQSAFKKNHEHHNVGTEGIFFRQRNRDRLKEPLGIAAGLNTQRRQWNYLFNFKPQVDFLSDKPKILPPPTSQQKQAKTGLQFRLTQPRGCTSGQQTKLSTLGPRRQDQPQRNHQPSLPSHRATEAPRSKSASAATRAHFKLQLQPDSKLFLPSTHLQPHTSQQARPPPKLNWMTQSRAERPRPVARHNSFDATYGTGQMLGGQVGRRPLHSSMNTPLRRSKSMNDRHSTRLNPNITKT
uniref:protein FAM83A isoform X2 n=1 Tax=Epinephelus lanceolatus TaxID=310571 RepID=UPI001447AB5C|nr:protein FAM83A isoform X2 [Epinephelus lanceolatus]